MLKLIPFLAAALAAAACNPPPEQGTAIIEGVLLVTGPDCTARPSGVGAASTFLGTSLLDIGFNAEGANELILPIQVATNLPSTFTTQTLTTDPQRSPNYPVYGNVDENIITFSKSEVFFSTDEDHGNQRQLQNDGTPVNDNTHHEAGLAGVVFNTQTGLLNTGAVFATAITKGDAALLQGEQFVATGLNAVNASGQTADNRVRIIANVRLVGITTGNQTVRTPPFPYPVELCAGCLTAVKSNTDCDLIASGTQSPKQNDNACFPGEDQPQFLCN